MEAGVTLSEGNQPLHKLKHVRIAFNPIPVEPAQFVILAVPVVIALLGLQHFVTGENHRNTLAQHQNSQQILRLTFSQGQ